MADPNRKINLDLPTSDESDPDQEFEPEEISLVKKFEEEFKNRFTEDDEYFMNFCKKKLKPPPIVFPYESYGHRGGGGGNRFHRGGGRSQYGNNQRFDNRNNRGGNHSNRHRYGGNNHRQQDYHHDSQQNVDYKRKRFNE